MRSSALPDTREDDRWRFDSRKGEGVEAVQPRPGTASGRVQTVLVIDDDDNLRDTVALMLEKEGFRVLDSTMFLRQCMPHPGVLTKRMTPRPEVLRDIEFGFPLGFNVRINCGANQH